MEKTTETQASVTSSSFTDRFTAYFNREIAQLAAKSLSDGAEIQFEVTGISEVFTFTKSKGKNQVLAQAASDPQLIFTLTPAAAEEILNDPADDIGNIGVNIMKLVVSKDPQRKVTVKLKAGFLSLFSKGYLGVITTGGSAFATYLASIGLNGMGAIKTALKNMKS